MSLGTYAALVEKKLIYCSLGGQIPKAHIVLKDKFGKKIILEFSEEEQKKIDIGEWGNVAGFGKFLAVFPSEERRLEYNESHQHHQCWLDDEYAAEHYGEARIVAAWFEK